jgi:hypothetical protein
LLARNSVNYITVEAPTGSITKVAIGETEIQAYDATKLAGDEVKAVPAAFAKSVNEALQKAGYPGTSNPTLVNIPIEPKDGLWNFLKMFDVFTTQKLTIIAILTIFVLYVTAVYGPIAAALVEFFPTRIRYTGLSLPYHIGNGWFGGFLPATAFAMVAATGDSYFGLWYPVVIALMTVVVGIFFVPETYKRDIFKEAPKS